MNAVVPHTVGILARTHYLGTALHKQLCMPQEHVACAA